MLVCWGWCLYDYIRRSISHDNWWSRICNTQSSLCDYDSLLKSPELVNLHRQVWLRALVVLAYIVAEKRLHRLMNHWRLQRHQLQLHVLNWRSYQPVRHMRFLCHLKSLRRDFFGWHMHVVIHWKMIWLHHSPWRGERFLDRYGLRFLL